MENLQELNTKMLSDSNHRIAKNTGMLYVRMLFTMAISLYTSRVVLNALGVEDFGIYNVVGGIVVIFGFLSSAMASSTQRFLTVALGKSDLDQVKRIFSMSITIHVFIAVFVLILSESVGLWFVNNQLNIPETRLPAANWVFQFSVFAFLITILNIPYHAAIIAYERMNVYAFISISEALLKLFIVFILVWISFDKLKLYAVLVFLVSTIMRQFYRFYCRSKFAVCKYSFIWDKKLFQELSSFANWNLLGVFAGIAYGQGVNIMLNIFFGPAINASRGIAFQVQNAVNGFVTNFQLAVNPPITKSYATDERQYMYSLIFNASKYSYFLLLLLSLPLLVETEYVIKLWLKTVPDYAVIFTRLILVDVLICSISGSLQTMAQATGKVRTYQLVVSGILLLNLPVSYLLLKIDFPPQSTFLVSIFLSFCAILGRLAVLKKNENFPVGKFFSSVIARVIVVSIASLILPELVYNVKLEQPMQLILVVLISVLSVIGSVFLLGMTNSERLTLKIIIHRLKSKIRDH